MAATRPRSQQMLYARSSTGRSLRLPGVHLRQRVQNRRRADPQPQVAGHQTQQVARLQRSGQRQEAGEQVELAALRARPFGGWRSGAACRRLRLPAGSAPDRPAVASQQLLGGLAEIAGFPHRGDNLVRLDAGRCRDGAQRHLLGQPQVYSGKFRALPAPGTDNRRWAATPAGSRASSVASRSINIKRPEACSKSRYASATTSYSTPPSSLAAAGGRYPADLQVVEPAGCGATCWCLPKPTLGVAAGRSGR